MAHSEKCPVCEGDGKVEDPCRFSLTTDTVDCHGCDGRGWVTVRGKVEKRGGKIPASPWYPYYVYYPQYPYIPYRPYEPYEPYEGATTISPDNITVSDTTYQVPEGTQVTYT